MEHFVYLTENTCCKRIEFDLSPDLKLHNVTFIAGCPGNLQAIAKLVEGKKAEEIQNIFAGNTCGIKPTSCADQLSIAIRKALKTWEKRMHI